jgi:hypothetical protein
MGVVKFSLSGKKPGQKGGDYFKPGEYVVEITNCKYVPVRNEPMPMFVLETKVVEAVDASDGTHAGAHRNWCQKLNTDWAAPNIMECIMSAYGEDPSDPASLHEEDHKYWDKKLDEAVGDAKPLNGRKVFVVCRRTLLKAHRTVPVEAQKADMFRDICSFFPYPE